ncbi:hypothetical protein, partial [Bacillus pumilus]|uniref:hypothetical protein n=1 Tax=Bacillus pumilus TaxID=1408 RepID=UPI003D013540
CFYMYQDKKRHDSDSVKIAQKAGETAIFFKTKTSKPKRPKTKPNFPAGGDFFFDFLVLLRNKKTDPKGL